MGIPVVSHLGLTPQSVGVMGYKLQGDTKTAAMQLIKDAKAGNCWCSSTGLEPYLVI